MSSAPFPALGLLSRDGERDKCLFPPTGLGPCRGAGQTAGRGVIDPLHRMNSSSLVSCSSCDNIQGFIEEFLQIFSSLLQEKR